jgi:hypothetical protein
MARELAARYGYSAFKLYPFANDETEDEMIARIAHFREGLGPDYRIMIDVWRTTDARLALSVARAIEKYNICWYEEPIGPDDLNVLRDIKMKTDLPLVAGEAMYGKRWFNEVCKLNCVDYINPDVSVVGGIAEMCDIAAIAEAVEIALENATVKPPLAEGELGKSRTQFFQIRILNGGIVTVYGDGITSGADYLVDTAELISSLSEIYERIDSEEQPAA